MAKWKNQYTPIENINGGNEYEIGDVPSPTMFNTAVENSNVAAQLGLNQPNNTDANNVGVPSVTIEQTSDGKNRFKFSNLKGDSGNPSGNILQELGDSTTDTLSQKVVTENLDNKLDKTQCNLQFNQLFKPDYIKNHTEKNVVFTNNGDGSVSLNGTATSKVIFLFRDIFLDHTHIYYYSTNPSSARSITTFVNKYDGGQSYLWRTTILKNCTKINYVYDEDSDLNFNYTIKPILIDLTKMFGAGNEPQTTNEAEKYIKYGTYYPYREPVNKGEINSLSMCPSNNYITDLFTKPNVNEERSWKAPANGWVEITIRGSKSGFTYNFETKTPTDYHLMSMTGADNNYAGAIVCLLPIAKNQLAKFVYFSGSCDSMSTRFIYAEEV